MTRVIKLQKVGESNSLVDKSPESALDEGIQKEKRKKKKKRIKQGVSPRPEDNQAYNGSTDVGKGNSSEIQKPEERGTQTRVVPTAAEESPHSVAGKKQKRKDKLKPDEQDNGHRKKKRKDKAVST